MLDLNQHPHRRYNPLTREWVLVSPQRMQRPWQGKIEAVARPSPPIFDPECYLCPGNRRAGGKRNPDYASTFVFDNDFPALLPSTPPRHINQRGLIVACGEPGMCRVVCFSPRHDLSMARMSPAEIRAVVDVWAEQYRELGSQPGINHVQIFENRGELMGTSNPHPHCQIWANNTLPNEVAREQAALSDYRADGGSCLLCDYLALEERGERAVLGNEHFTALVPFWAIWPFETLVLARGHVTDLDALSGAERDALADILKRLITRYDRLFDLPFPYSMGFHQRPTDGDAHPEWHLHAHFYPPLLRSAAIQKFMVGYEMLGTPQRDLTPEAAAARLREIAD